MHYSAQHQAARLTKLQKQLARAEEKIKKLAPQPDITDHVARLFHHGRVGSGRNTPRLNQQRERALDKTIDNAVALTALQKQRDQLAAQIKDIESGGPARRAANDHEANAVLALYWEHLSEGEAVDIGGQMPVIVYRKNTKSFIDTSGLKWTAAEVIGRAAAALIGKLQPAPVITL